MFIPANLIKTPNFDNATPNTYSYITATDTLDQVAAPFYFAGSDIRPSDVISVRSIDGEMTFTANGLTAMPSVGVVAASVNVNNREIDYAVTQKIPDSAQVIASTTSSSLAAGRYAISPLSYGTKFTMYGAGASDLVSQGAAYATKVRTTRAFWYNGANLEIKAVNQVGGMIVYADGMCIGSMNSAGGSNTELYWNFPLGSAKLRLIEIEGLYEYLSAIVAESGTVTIPYLDLMGPRIAFMGDSWTAGNGSSLSSFSGAWVTNFGRYIRNRNIITKGIGGTGYLNDSVGDVYQDRIEDILTYSPDFIVTSGSQNDFGYTTTQYSAAVDSYYSSLISAGVNPNKIIITGVFYPKIKTFNAKQLQFNAILQAKAVEIGAYYVDNADWFTGTGNTSAPTGDGNADIFCAADNAHPNSDGSRYTASKFGNWWNENIGL